MNAAERGQSSLGFLILLAFIAVLALVGLSALSSSTNTTIDSTTEKIRKAAE